MASALGNWWSNASKQSPIQQATYWPRAAANVYGRLKEDKQYTVGAGGIPTFGALAAAIRPQTAYASSSGEMSKWGTTPAASNAGETYDPGLSAGELGKLYSAANGTGADAAAAQQKLAQYEAAKARYQTRYGEAQKFRETGKQFAEDQYNTAVARAGEKKGELASAYETGRGSMKEALGSTRRGLTSAYSSRGLSDSSFAQKAQAEADIAFNNNLSNLNKEEATKVKEVDNYLTDLRKQREYSIAETNYQDFENAQDYEDAIANLDSEIAAIKNYQDQLRSSVASTTSGITGISSTQDATLTFANDLEKIYSSALPAAQKKQLTASIFSQMGRKDPNKDADYWEDYMNGRAAIDAGTETADSVNQKIQSVYGIAPF